MLAYVFWHWKNPRLEAGTYEEYLKSFHGVLNEQRPAGFHSSAVFQVAGLPWTGGESGAYEDWYYVENSAALDPLDLAAVSEARKQPHDQVAQWAGGGTGGLYRLRAASPHEADRPETAFWFSKPASLTYGELYQLLAEQLEQVPGKLWQRQMTLGPAREFCWHTTVRQSLPGVLEAADTLRIPLSTIWQS